jgi:hypothetical protein
MSSITLRLVKGSPLTNAEVDANFSNLNTDKYQAGDSPDFVDILTDKLSLDTAATPGVLTAGEMAWNVDEGTADLGLNGGDVILQIGQETHYRVVNKTGSTITNGALCMYDGTIGDSGQIRVKPWIGGSDPLLIMGIATADILNDARGYVTTFGKIRGINTTGIPYGETWLDGDTLYAGPSGGLTKVRPAAPNTKSVIAAVVKAHATVGELLVRVTLSSSIENDDEVELTSITDKDVLQWNATNSRFENKSFAAAGLQATLVSGDNIKTVNGNSLVGSGGISVGTVTSVSGTGSYGGLTLSGTVTESGSLTFGGTPTGTWPIDISGNAATATSATSATIATNLAGGATGSVPYQSAAGTTTFLAAGTNGQILTLASGVPTWAAAPATGITITDDTSTNATRYLTFTSATTGTITGENVSSTKLQFNPSTGVLTSTSFSGAGTGLTGTASSLSIGGNAATATSAITATNLANGLANQIAYQTGASATSFITAPTNSNTYLSWNGSAFAWSSVTTGALVTALGLGTFTKADPTIVAWTKTGNFTVSTATTLYIEVNGEIKTIAASTAVTMPSAVVGTDYAIWAKTDGTLEATSNHTSPPTANARKVGGFHYAPGGNATGTSGGNTTAQINAYSFWDLKFRPACPDPRGMTLVGGGFWADIYLTGVDAITNGSSKYNVTIGDGSSPPKVPTMFGGNGTTTYGSYTWFQAMELATAFGKKCPTQMEFMSLAYGTTEASSIGTDQVSTILNASYTSKWGVIQSSGCMWVWTRDRAGPFAAASWNANTGGRGSEYNAPNAGLLGGSWGVGSYAGSRCSDWAYAASTSYSDVGSRFVCDHLQLD